VQRPNNISAQPYQLKMVDMYQLNRQQKTHESEFNHCPPALLLDISNLSPGFKELQNMDN
jgi:hypothetical protein